MRKRPAPRKAVGTIAPILVEAKPNARWSLDFVHDQLASGRPFRILNAVYDVTRECLCPKTCNRGKWRINQKGSGQKWMKVQWQATCFEESKKGNVIFDWGTIKFLIREGRSNASL